MHTISRDTPALYITAVAKDRLPVFRTDPIKVITCRALDDARKSGGFAIYAYVPMPDHFHAITDSILKPSKVLQFINGIISHCTDRATSITCPCTSGNPKVRLLIASTELIATTFNPCPSNLSISIHCAKTSNTNPPR